MYIQYAHYMKLNFLFLRVILCKGMDYPPVQPRPIMSTLPLFVPLCEPQTEKSNIEVTNKYSMLLSVIIV